MEIKRGNFRFNRIVNVNEILNESALFSMNQEDIDNDAIVNGERLEDGDELIVFQNTLIYYNKKITSGLIELLLLIVLTNAIVVGLLKLHVPLQIVFVRYTHIHQT